jgi:hypothetical protein
MLGLSFQPSLAFRAAAWLSIGGGPNVMVGFLRNKAGINTLNPRLGDGQVRCHNWTVNVGGNIGILLTPRRVAEIQIDRSEIVNSYPRPITTHIQPLKANRFLLHTERMLAESGEFGGGSLRCAAGRKNTAFRAEFPPSPKFRQNVRTGWWREVDSNCRYRSWNTQTTASSRISQHPGNRPASASALNGEL